MHSAPKTIPRQAPRSSARRPAGPRRHPRASRRRSLGWRARTILAAALLCVAILAWAWLARVFAPAGNTSASRFDAIVVLGAKIDDDGNPGQELLSRLTEGVREYDRGVAPRIVVTGGEQHGHIQAEIMARILEAQGVPASAIFLESEADNTIQNACLSARIMKNRGWTSAEIVTSPSHLPRAAIVFSRVPIQWRMHAAPPLEPESRLDENFAAAGEVLHTVHYLLFSSWADRCSP